VYIILSGENRIPCICRPVPTLQEIDAIFLCVAIGRTTRKALQRRILPTLKGLWVVKRCLCSISTLLAPSMPSKKRLYTFRTGGPPVPARNRGRTTCLAAIWRLELASVIVSAVRCGFASQPPWIIDPASIRSVIVVTGGRSPPLTKTDTF